MLLSGLTWGERRNIKEASRMIIQSARGWVQDAACRDMGGGRVSCHRAGTAPSWVEVTSHRRTRSDIRQCAMGKEKMDFKAS